MMIYDDFIVRIHSLHRDCCVADRCEEQCCELRTDGIPQGSFAIICGDRFGNNHDLEGDLFDCIVFGRTKHSFICVVELKSGNPTVGHAIEQISPNPPKR